MYSNLNEKKFKILTIIGCFVADLFTAGYIYEKMAKEEQFKDAVAVSFELAKTLILSYKIFPWPISITSCGKCLC
ncbi:hypothetical protein M901_2449 [Bacteriovorax sp. DB6_IX]|nr:hypothetical protein M901_2449 [Bacteriovorax sp. DB6_IX]